MLLDIDVFVSVKNDGKDNNQTGVKVKLDHTLNDCLTALALAQKAIQDSLQQYITKKYGTVTEEEFNELYKTLTFNDINEVLYSE